MEPMAENMIMLMKENTSIMKTRNKQARTDSSDSGKFWRREKGNPRKDYAAYLKKENSRKDDAAYLKKENSRKDDAASLKKENSRKDDAANLKKENSRKDDAANLKQARVALVQISRGSLKKALSRFLFSFCPREVIKTTWTQRDIPYKTKPDDAANLKKENSGKDNAANLKKENSRK